MAPAMLMQMDDSFISSELNLNIYEILGLGKSLHYSFATSVKEGFFFLHPGPYFRPVTLFLQSKAISLHHSCAICLLIADICICVGAIKYLSA